MKIIDILNKIANGEIKDKTEFAIKFRGGIERKVYYDKKEAAFFNCLKNISDDEAVYDDVAFDDEIELLENNKNKKSKEIKEIENILYNFTKTSYTGIELSENFETITELLNKQSDKINELVRAVNKLIKEEEDKWK